MEKKTTRPQTTPPSSVRRESGESSPPLLTISDEELYERVMRKAYELYQQRGEEPGHEIEDWVTAERLVHAELLHSSVAESEDITTEEEEIR